MLHTVNRWKYLTSISLIFMCEIIGKSVCELKMVCNNNNNNNNTKFI